MLLKNSINALLIIVHDLKVDATFPEEKIVIHFTNIASQSVKIDCLYLTHKENLLRTVYYCTVCLITVTRNIANNNLFVVGNREGYFFGQIFFNGYFYVCFNCYSVSGCSRR